MARRTIFNATFCCGNMLQQFEVDSNCCNIVARTLYGKHYETSTIVYLFISPFSFSLLTRFLLLKINFLLSVKCSQDIGFF